MSYQVLKSNGSVLATVADQSVDTTDCSLTLIGRGSVQYGQAMNENLVRLLENFANVTAPARPIAGQLWYDTSSKTLNAYNGTTWSGVGANASGVGTMTQINTGTGLTGGPITTSGTIALANTTVTPGTYANPTITVDATGRVTAATTGSGVTLPATGVTAGTYSNATITVSADGRVTAATNGGATTGGGLTQTDADLRYLKLTGGTVTGDTFHSGKLIAGGTSVLSSLLPDTKLWVNGRASWTDGTTVMSANVGNLGSAQVGGGIGTTTAHPFSLWAGSAPRMIVTANGDVGIGTMAPSAGTADTASYPSKVLEVKGRIRSATGGPLAVNTTTEVGIDMAALKTATGEGIAAIGTSSKHPMAIYMNSGQHFRFTKLVINQSASPTVYEDLTWGNEGGPSLMIYGKPMAESNPVNPGITPSHFQSDTVIGAVTAWQLPRQDNADPARAAPCLDIGTWSLHPLRMRVGGYIGMAWNPTTFDTYAYGNNAFKPNGGLWAGLSDRRLKTDIRPFSMGLEAVCALAPKLFKYKNDVGMYSGEHTAPERDFVGLIAQEAEETPIAPWIVGSTRSVIDPESQEETDVLTIDATAITYALVNAVKDLNDKVAALEARLASGGPSSSDPTA